MTSPTTPQTSTPATGGTPPTPTEWSGHIEWIATEDLTDDHLVAIAEHLADHAAIPGREPEPDRAGVTLTVTAPTLRQALDVALAAVTAAVRAQGLPCRIVGADLVDDATFAARLDQPVIPELVGSREASELLGVSKQRVGQLAQTHARFPAPVVTLASGPVYLRTAIEAFDRGWTRQRTGRPRKTTAPDTGNTVADRDTAPPAAEAADSYAA